MKLSSPRHENEFDLSSSFDKMYIIRNKYGDNGGGDNSDDDYDKNLKLNPVQILDLLMKT